MSELKPLTDNEIIKAFESCQVEVHCLAEDCPYFGHHRCARRLLDDTLLLFRRQQAEIETLKMLLSTSNVGVEEEE